MSPLFVLLGAVDALAAVLIFFPFSEALVLYVMIYMIAKGGFFLLSAITSKAINPLFIGLSIIDILTGIILGAVSFDFISPMLRMIGVISLVKGLYSFIMPIFS